MATTRTSNASGLPPDARERLRAAIRDRVIPRLGTDPQRAQSAVARAIGFTPAAINRLMVHGTGGSLEMVTAVAAYLCESPSCIMYGADGSAAAKATNGILVRDVRGFAEAMKDARKRRPLECPHVHAHVLEQIADVWLFPVPRVVTATLLLQLAICSSGARRDGGG